MTCPLSRIVSESGRIRHADEFELHQRLFDLERFRHELAQFLRIGAIGDDQKFAMIEAIGTDRIGRARQRHGERPLSNLSFSHNDLLCVAGEIRWSGNHPHGSVSR